MAPAAKNGATTKNNSEPNIAIVLCMTGRYPTSVASSPVKLAHTVKLMPPKYVKAYVMRGKTDAGDAGDLRGGDAADMSSGEGARAPSSVDAAERVLVADRG